MKQKQSHLQGGALLQFGPDGDVASVAFLILDSMISAARAGNRISPTDPITLDTFDRIAARASAQHTSVLSILAESDTEPDLQLVAFVTTLAIMDATVQKNWEQLADFISTSCALWPEYFDRDGSPETKILFHLATAVTSLADIVDNETIPAEQARVAGKAFDSIAAVLEQLECFEDALACANTAGSLLCFVNDALASKAASRSVLLARKLGDPAFILKEHTWKAHIIAKGVNDGFHSSIEAFDAVEAALRALPYVTDPPTIAVDILRSWLQEDYLRALRPLLWATLPSLMPDDAIQYQNIITSYGSIVPVVVPGSYLAWVQHLEQVGTFITEIETHRLRLEPIIPQAAVTVSWIDRTISHNALRRSVPHNNSLRREDEITLDDRLLEIMHETVHVLTMYGGCGMALMAMHWALMETELDMVRHADEEEILAISEGIRDPRLGFSPVSIEIANFGALGHAERQLEIERKTQILAQIWTPWLEGIAVFAELAADPESDTVTRSTPTSVINELWDFRLSNDDMEVPARNAERLQDKLLAADRRFSEAQRRLGPTRFRTYIAGYPSHYLAGYAAVRSVVAAWRATLNVAHSGAILLPALLHATQFGGYDSIPDSSLPIDEFQQQAIDLHLRWIAELASATADDLNSLLDNYRGSESSAGSLSKSAAGAHWNRGRVIWRKDEAASQVEFSDWFQRMASQTLLSLVGERADAERVIGADERCRYCVEICSKTMGEMDHKPRMLTEEWMYELLRGAYILPLGQADCPFWLCHDENRLSVLIRTRDDDKDTRNASYNVISIALEQGEMTALHERFERVGQARMRVSRIADLYHNTYLTAGTQYLVFQYEDWVHSMPQGTLLQLPTVESDVQARIRQWAFPNPLVKSAKQLFGERHSAARRTRDWVASSNWAATDIDGLQFNLAPWAERLRSLATAVIEDESAPMPGAREAVSVRLLKFVLDDVDAANQLQTTGFSELRAMNQRQFDALLKFLFDTAKIPQSDVGEFDPETVETYVGKLFERGIHGWDIVRPQEKI